MTQIPSFSPTVAVQTPGLNLQPQETQFDQLRSVLLGAGTQAARAFAAEGTRNQQMEALRDRARSQSEARQAQVAARFDQANLRAQAAEQQRQAGLQRKRMNQISDKQMSLQLRARDRGPEWLLSQATSEFNNAANTDERRAWFPLLNQAHELVQKSELDAERKERANTLVELSLAGDTAKKAADIMVGELQADPDLRRELIGDGTNIHSRVLEYVIGEAASVAPDLFNVDSDDPQIRKQSQDLVAQLERQAVRVGDALIQEYQRNVEGANQRVGLQKLEAVANSYIDGAGIDEIELDSGDRMVMVDALNELRKEHFNHLPDHQWEEVVDGFVTEAAINLGRLSRNVSIKDAAEKLSELEKAFPQRAGIIAQARQQMERSMEDRLANRTARSMAEHGIQRVTPENFQMVQFILNDEANKMEVDAGIGIDADMTDEQTRLFRVLQAAENTLMREFTGASEQMAQQRVGIDRARAGLEGGDVKALWESGVQFAIQNGLPLDNQQKMRIMSLMGELDDATLDTVYEGLSNGSLLQPFDPRSVEEGADVEKARVTHQEMQSRVKDAAVLAEAFEWEFNKSTHKPIPKEMIDSALTNLKSLDPDIWRRQLLQLTEGFSQTNRDEFMKGLANSGPEGDIIAEGLYVLGAKTITREDSLDTIASVITDIQQRLTNPAENTTEALLKRTVLDAETGLAAPTPAGEKITNQIAINDALLNQFGWSNTTQPRSMLSPARLFGSKTKETDVPLTGDEMQERLKKVLEDSPFDLDWMQRMVSTFMQRGDNPEQAAARVTNLVHKKGYDLVDRNDRPALVYVGNAGSVLGNFSKDHQAMSREITREFSSPVLFEPGQPDRPLTSVDEPTNLQFRRLVETLDMAELRQFVPENVPINTVNDAVRALLVQRDASILDRIDDPANFFSDDAVIEFEPDWNHRSWNEFVNGAITEDGTVIAPQVPLRVRVAGVVYRLPTSETDDTPLLFWHSRPRFQRGRLPGRLVRD